jgi:flagellar biosynthesis protein FlhA
MINDRKNFEFKNVAFTGTGDITAIVVTSSIIAIFFLMICPIPVLLLDILITFNIIFAFAILIIALCTKKGAGSLYKIAFILSTVFIFSINIASIRLILTNGTGFDGVAIRFISNFMTSQGNDGLAVGFLIFIALTWIQWQIIIILKRGAIEAAQSALNSFPEKERTIIAERTFGLISSDESSSQKEVLLRETYFYSLLEGACGLISGNEILRIVIFIATILGGILISTNTNSEITNDTIIIIISYCTFIEAIKIYAPLAISSGILFMFPVFLHTVAIAITLSRTVIGNEAKEKTWKRIKNILSSISPWYNSR